MMNQRTIRAGLVLVAISGLSGCCTPKEVHPVAIDEALASLGRGFAMMKQSELQWNNGKDFKTGLMPTEASVTFAVAKAYTKEGKLYVEVAPPAQFPVAGKAGGEYDRTTTQQAANTISVTFRSVLFQSTTTSSSTQIVGHVTNVVTTVKTEGIADPERVSGILKVLEQNGVQYMLPK